VQPRGKWSEVDIGVGTGPELHTRRPRADALRNAARVLEAARDVFAEQGSDASLEEIARRAGVGIGTLYRHFPTRDALVEAVFRDTVDASTSRGEQLLISDDPAGALATWLREQLRLSSACRGLAAEAMIMMLDDQGCGASNACDALHEIGAKLLRRAQQSGSVRADTEIDDLLRLVNAIGLATEDAPDREGQSDRMFALMIEGLRVAS
jgi:AcrR family transcriptional regulator